MISILILVTAWPHIIGSLLKNETIKGAAASTMAMIIKAIIIVVFRQELSTSRARSNLPAPRFWAAMVAAALVIAVIKS